MRSVIVNSDSSTSHSSGTSYDVSIVVPIYNELENITPLYEDIDQCFSEAKVNYEIVFVDDGSEEPTNSLLRKLATSHDNITVIELARNFGQQLAITAGLNHVQGQSVLIMDGDRQDPPKVALQLYKKLREGFDVVYAIRTKRKESIVMRWSYAFYYKILSFLSHIEIPLDSGDFCAMDRSAVDLLNKLPERSRFIRGLRSWVGLRQIGLEYERQARVAGDPGYTLRKLFQLGSDGIISFSYIPLRLISCLGLIVSGFSILLAIFYMIKKILVGLSPPGFATIVVMISFFSGMQLITLGIIGEYVGRIFEEAKQRPLFIVRDVISKKNSAN